MSRRNYFDLDAELLLRLANRTDITANMRSNFIRDAYLNVAMMFKHPELQEIEMETIAYGNFFLIPTHDQIWYPIALRNETDGYIIRQDSLERVERVQNKPLAPPYTYYWFNKIFFFESHANTEKIVKVWFKRKPVEFSGGGFSEMDELFDPFIIMDAARIGYETVRDFDEAKVQLTLFNAEATRKKLPLEEASLNDYRQGWKMRFK